MKNKTAWIIVLCISGFGILFSGYLSFNELNTATCPAGGCSANYLFGFPVCVYGLLMYIIIFIISIFGLRIKK